MGQRTQVLIVKKHNNGKKTYKFCHLQWGYGRQMYLTMMDLFINDYFKDTFKRDYSYDDVMPDSVFDREGSRGWEYKKIPSEVFDNLNLDDLATVKALFDYGDNNNGGMVIEMTEAEESYRKSDFTIGFLLGWEDAYTYDEENPNKRIEIEPPFSRWLTPQEYGEMNGGSNFSDPLFVKMFDDFCEYFGIKRIGKDVKRWNEEEKEEENKEINTTNNNPTDGEEQD